MFSFKNKFHIHRFKTLQKESYLNCVMRDLGITDTNEIRICTICGKVQERYVHCYGMHPPEYDRTWHTIEGKPRIKKLYRGEK